MEKTNKVEAVTERDIDLLLLEELNVSDDFSTWFYSLSRKTMTNLLLKGPGIPLQILTLANQI